ncbi:MAG: twin-arginine translocation pathway signal sequence domain-containing protein [Micavibrio aeruginosavorus]|uniref:Murein endopeptidase K n=1 Tax=Micavibrio aeruginosavorus TaxID=349221 RepID=A0A2W5N3N7_9BACT|nr:MAG: twin-arginine translocation pathway signal sequence domain-containing protein [Micavibrio aeruginosavorus]
MTSQTTGTPASSESRRKFLGFGALALGSLTLTSLAKPASAAIFSRGDQFSGARKIAFRNTHTGETFSGVYRVGDKYLPDAFDRINIVLRDFRSNQLFPIDPRVMDIIYSVHQLTQQAEPYEVLSGYRCPKTNASLRSHSEGVAKNSLHMTGQAIDLRLPGYNTKQIRSLAVSLKAGGVGYYPKSDFVHMDSGDVRTW